MVEWRTVSQAGEVDEEILELATSIHDSFYSQGEIDWHDFLDRMDGTVLKDGKALDLDGNLNSPAIVKIKTHVRLLRKEQ